MSCRHEHGDPACSSTTATEAQEYLRRKYGTILPPNPDPHQYTIEDVRRVGPHVVMRVNYPSCKKCSYEGNKVLVFLNVLDLQIMRWRTLDPHFRDPLSKTAPTEAPSPAARFPASEEGWMDAIAYAKSKCPGVA